ncbi:MAG: L-threonylcarbamoyladenylate synthase [Gaiellaceae bacterium]
MSDEAVAAIRAGRVVVLPTDTVYGLVADACEPAACDALYALKGRDAGQPSALVAASVGVLLSHVPELAVDIVRALLPGPFTLVLPNPAQRFAWLCGEDPSALGVRVPAFDGPGKAVLNEVGVVVATSANLPGGSEPRRLDDVPAALRLAAAAVVEGGELPGIPSTVLDLTGAAPRVIRDGAGDAAAALAIVSRLLR